MATELNQPAPEFTLPDFDDRIHLLSDYRGRIVLINFWSAECPHSERTDHLIAKWFQDWGQDVTWLTIASNANESDELIAGAACQRDLPVVLRDADHSVADRFEAQTTPHVFVVDPQGVLRYRGAVDDVAFQQRQPTRFYLFEVIQALLAGRHPKITETQPFGCVIVRYA